MLASQYLLQSTATIYEVYHANQFKTVGGLFPSHESSLIEAGVYQELLQLGGRQAQKDRRPIAAGTFNVDALSVEDIIEIRKTDEFLEYCKKLRLIARPAANDTFYDANQHLVDYIGSVYLPSITRRFPKAGFIQAITKMVGTVGGTALPVVVTLATSDDITVVSLTNRAMFVIICGAAGRIAGYYAPELVEFLRDWRRKKALRRYRKNNYTGLE